MRMSGRARDNFKTKSLLGVWRVTSWGPTELVKGLVPLVRKYKGDQTR